MKFSLAVLIGMTVIPIWPGALYAQGRQQVKVLVEFSQSGDRSRESAKGSGRIVIGGGGVRPSARFRVKDTQTKVQQSTGIFTLVQDGGESILSVATRVPFRQLAFYRNYATAGGYVRSGLVFQEVGTSLKVGASILPDNQIKVRLVPRISYFSPGGAGAIDFTEASTELVVPSGQPVVIGGSSTKIHRVTRQILGYGEDRTGNETTVAVTATIQ